MFAFRPGKAFLYWFNVAEFDALISLTNEDFLGKHSELSLECKFKGIGWSLAAHLAPKILWDLVTQPRRILVKAPSRVQKILQQISINFKRQKWNEFKTKKKVK